MNELRLNRKHFIGDEERDADWFKCPNCKSVYIRLNDKYCSNCGIKLNFDDYTKYVDIDNEIGVLQDILDELDLKIGIDELDLK